MKYFAALAVLGVMLMAGTQAAAQAAPPTIVRGVVAQVSPSQVVVNGRDGRTVTVALAPGWKVAVLSPITIDAIQPGSFIGASELPQADGTGVALEVHVFPPGAAMGAGHYPWDADTGAMMTNGTVGVVTAVSAGHAIDVSYPSGTRRLLVPDHTPIVQITPGGAQSLITPGSSVFIVAARQPGGGLVANAISTGEGGAAPPM